MMNKKAPNLLENFALDKIKTNLSKSGVFVLFLLGIVLVVLQVFYPTLAALVMVSVLVVCLISFFMSKPIIGFYILAVVSLFNGIELNFSQYEWSRNLPLLLKINAPLGDFFAVILFVSVLLSLLASLLLPYKKLKHALLPTGWVLYGTSLLTGLCTSFYAYDHLAGISIYFWLRNILFVYFAFVVVPYHVINNKEEIIKLFKIWFYTGLGIALFGLSSLFMGVSVDWLRVTPYYIKGIAPLGVNHNLLAEPLVMIIPGVLFLYLFHKAKKESKMYLGGLIFIIAIALLTLSRAAWLSVLVGILIMAIFNFGKVRDYFRHKQIGWNWLWVTIFLPVLVYMGLFLIQAPIVVGSTISRWESTKIVWFYFMRRPWFGYGSGMYLQLFNDVKVFWWEYGDPLEAHGFLQKILLEHGSIGLVLFLGFLFFVSYKLYKKFKQTAGYDLLMLQMIFVCMWMGIVFQLFNTSYYRSVMWLPIGLSVVAIKLFKDKNKEYE
jgi:hypothetical protein